MKALEILAKELSCASTRATRPLKRVFLEITNRCNLGCGFCYNPNKSSELPTDRILAAIDSVYAAYGSAIDFSISGGEPTLHPGFFDVTASLGEKGFIWTLSTNGTLLDDDTIATLLNHGCRSVAVSLDAVGLAHDRIRKGRNAFSETMRSLEKLHARADALQLHVTTTVTKHNVTELPKIAEALAPFPAVRWRINPVKMPKAKMDLWMDEPTYAVMVGFFLKYQATHDRRLKLGETSRLSHKYGEYLTDKLDKCNAGATVFGVVANGDVVTCMVNRDQVLGNVLAGDDLVEIWKGADLKFCKNLCSAHFNHQNAAR